MSVQTDTIVVTETEHDSGRDTAEDELIPDIMGETTNLDQESDKSMVQETTALDQELDNDLVPNIEVGHDDKPAELDVMGETTALDQVSDVHLDENILEEENCHHGKDEKIGDRDNSNIPRKINTGEKHFDCDQCPSKFLKDVDFPPPLGQLSSPL